MGGPLLQYANEPLKEDNNIRTFPRTKKVSYKEAKEMELVPEEMDHNPFIGTRKSGREKKKPDRLNVTSSKGPTYMPSICFAMFDSVQTVLPAPKNDLIPSYKPLDLIPETHNNYDAFAYNCRIDSYN